MPAGLALARWVAQTYLCSLREALTTVVLADAVPRVVERLVPSASAPGARALSERSRTAGATCSGATARQASSPAALLRHPEARRSGDRAHALAALGALVRGGVLERRRTFVRPPVERAHDSRARAGRARFADEVPQRWPPTCATTRRCAAPTRCWPDSATPLSGARSALARSSSRSAARRSASGPAAGPRADGRAARRDRCARGRDRRRRIRAAAGATARPAAARRWSICTRSRACSPPERARSCSFPRSRSRRRRRSVSSAPSASASRSCTRRSPNANATRPGRPPRAAKST